MAIINLSRNELDHALSKPVLNKAFSLAAPQTNRYPLELLEEVDKEVEKIFAYSGRSALLTRGVDDAVDSVLRTNNDLTPLVFTPTFSGFLERFYVLALGFDSISLDYRHRLSQSVFDSVDKKHFAFLANPNNPTGTFWAGDKVDRIANSAGRLFLDETYIDFARAPSMEARVPVNTFVFRSFSKAYGLAGIRLGVLTGHPEAINRIRSTRVYCPIDVFSLCLLKEVLSRGGGKPLANLTKLIDIRSKTLKSLRDLGLKVPDSRTNFLVAFIGEARDAVAFFRENGILVKDLEKDGMPGWLRITIGSAQDMKKFVAIVKVFQQKAQFSTPTLPIRCRVSP